MPLSPVTKLYAVQDCEISPLYADYAAGNAPTAPTAPSAPVITNAGTPGVVTYTYTVILSNGTDSVASAAGTTTTGNATLSAANYNIVTLASPVPAGQVAIVQRTVGGLTQGVIGKLRPGSTVLNDTGLPSVSYVANSSGVLYGPKIKVPGIKSILKTETVKNVDLRGDFQELDSDAIPTSITVQFTFAKQNIEALAVMEGGTTIYAGTTPSQTATYRRLGSSKFGLFKLEAQSVGADPPNGDAHLVFWKCRLSSHVKNAFAEENYETFDATAKVMPRNADNFWWDMVVNETAAAIA